jgi:hypothetical protein
MICRADPDLKGIPEQRVNEFYSPPPPPHRLYLLAGSQEEPVKHDLQYRTQTHTGHTVAMHRIYK